MRERSVACQTHSPGRPSVDHYTPTPITHTGVINFIVEPAAVADVIHMIHLACGVLLVLAYALTPVFL